jgi:uncharacterized cupin superfamily protein
MGMRINRLADATPFEPQGHHGVGPVRLQGGEAAPTEGVTVVLSHYLPGGEAEMSPQPAETIYVVVAGELVVTSEGTEETLRPFDSAHFTTGTLRQMTNRTKLPASLLVIRTTS